LSASFRNNASEDERHKIPREEAVSELIPSSRARKSTTNAPSQTCSPTGLFRSDHEIVAKNSLAGCSETTWIQNT